MFIDGIDMISKVVDHMRISFAAHEAALAEEMNVNAENTKDLAKYQKKLKNATRHIDVISKVVDHMRISFAETLAEEMNVNAENTKDLAKYQKKLKNATRHIDEKNDIIAKQQKELDEKNDIIAKHQKEQSENHQEDLASNRAYSVALLEKYQKKLKNAAMKLDEKNDIIAKQQKHSRRIHDLIAKQQKELAEKNELISAIRKRLCPDTAVFRPSPLASSFVCWRWSNSDSTDERKRIVWKHYQRVRLAARARREARVADDHPPSKKQERKGVTFEHVQTEQLVYATTDEADADDTTPRTPVTDAVYTCHEYDEYDELDYDPGLADIIAYINDDDTRFSFVLPVAKTVPHIAPHDRGDVVRADAQYRRQQQRTPYNSIVWGT